MIYKPSQACLNEIALSQATALAYAAATAQALASESKASNTRRAYTSDWEHFDAWSKRVGLPSLPAAPETIALYVAAHADTLKPATVSRRLASISTAHRAAGLENPASMRHGSVADVVRGLRRVKGTVQAGKSALTGENIRFLIAGLPSTLQGDRDAALLLLGFSGAFRRSELVALDVDDLEFGEKGLRITLARSKTDQEGQGRYVGIPYSANHMVCPIRRLQRWLSGAAITNGPVFRPMNKHGHVSPERLSGQGVWLVVRRVCADAGMDADEFGAHSLRSGFVTTALGAGKSETTIIGQTGHKSTIMLRRYHKEKDLFKNNAAEGLL